MAPMPPGAERPAYAFVTGARRRDGDSVDGMLVGTMGSGFRRRAVVLAALASACSEVTPGATVDAGPGVDVSAPVDRPDVVATPDRPDAVDAVTVDAVTVDAVPTDRPVSDACLVCGGEAGTRCVDARTDRNHCGGCDRVCSEWDDCVDGDCRTRCAGGRVACDFACVDLRTDPNHCGRCGRRCCPGSVCSDGACAFGCSAGTTRCCASSDPAACDCSCRDLATDGANCGGCGVACAAGQVCRQGRCEGASGCSGGGSACAAGLCACSGRCTDLRTDVANCGRCGELCAVGETCRAGLCTPVARDAGAPDA
jgi:hypothetical protein